MRVGLRHARDGRFFPLSRAGSTIGTDRGCEIVLDEPEVAHAHARIVITETGIEIDGFGSPSRTFVNDHEIGKHFLSGGDEVRIGQATLHLELSIDDSHARGRCVCGAEVGEPGKLCRRCETKGTSKVDRPAAFAPGERPVLELAETPDRGARKSASDWPPDYEQTGVLGEGSQGRVYELRHLRTGRLVAAKRLFCASLRALRRLEREIEALRRLDHTAIVRLIDIWRAESTAVLLMEHVDGPSLAKIVRRDGWVETRRALELCARVAEGLAYASAHGIVHRDVKPSNVLVGSDGSPKLSDFGLVAFLETRTRLTADDECVGTPNYMAPEQVNGESVDGRTDVWGVGATCYHALTGNLPFDALAPSELFRRIVKEPVDLAPVRDRAGERVARLLARCLEKKLEDRPSPEEAAHELSTLAREARP